MAKNYNIQTVSEHMDEAAAASHTVNIGGIVAAGMTRYVTFLRVNPLTPANNGGSKVYLCSGAASVGLTGASATLAQKIVIEILSSVNNPNKHVMVPPAGPDTEHPLFTVASGAYLNAHLATAGAATSSVQLFVQFYDE